MYDVFQTDRLIDLWLTEDIGYCDLTAQLMIEAHETGAFFMNARETLIVAGVDVAARIFKRYDPTLEVSVRVKDGDKIERGTVMLDVSGTARSVLTAERTALNIVQRLSGIANLTEQYVAAVAGTEGRFGGRNAQCVCAVGSRAVPASSAVTSPTRAKAAAMTGSSTAPRGFSTRAVIVRPVAAISTGGST